MGTKSPQRLKKFLKHVKMWQNVGSMSGEELREEGYEFPNNTRFLDTERDLSPRRKRRFEMERAQGLKEIHGCGNKKDITAENKTTITTPKMRIVGDSSVNLLEIASKRDETPIMEAAYSGRKVVFDLLMRYGGVVSLGGLERDPREISDAEMRRDDLYSFSSQLKDVFYGNSIGKSSKYRTFGNLMASVNDWTSEHNYSRIAHKLYREIGIEFGEGDMDFFAS